MKNRTVSTPRRNKRAAPSPSKPTFLAGLDWGLLRLWAVGFLLTFFWLALWGRAYYLQIIKGEELAELARRQHQYTETISGVRGDILDRHGNVLARSIVSSSISINPKLVVDKALTASVLGGILEMPASQVMGLLGQKKNFIWVARKVDIARGKQVQEARLPGVAVVSEYTRVYPYGALAGQLLGFVNTDEKGIEGLELTYDALLGGKQSKQVVERDAGRRRLAVADSGLGDLRGQDVRLTIDSQVQFFAEEALAESVQEFGGNWGGCIVVDVPTGEILAWAQYPFFDPNNHNKFAEAIRRNRLATDALEHGSTIKSFLIAAALQENVIKTSTQIDCEKGKWKIGKNIIHDTKPYAILTVEKILHVSSNIGVAKIGQLLGKTKYEKYLRELGFGDTVDLPLAGQSKGILRASTKWQDLDLAAASFGQGFSATIVQLANAYLKIAQGEMETGLKLETSAPSLAQNADLVEPSLPAEETPNVQNVFSANVKKEILNMLRLVVEEEGGTGKAARIPGLVAGGKTGTAQKTDKSGKYGSGRVSSFVGLVPIEEPRYLIISLVDEPKKTSYGGVVAAPIFRHVALHTMAYHGFLPDTDDPLVLAIAQKNAAKKLQQAGGKSKVVTALADLETKANKADAPLPVSYGKNQVPELVGLGVKDAVNILVSQGIIPNFKGNGLVVVKQQPSAGSPLSGAGQEVVLWLEDGQI